MITQLLFVFFVGTTAYLLFEQHRLKKDIHRVLDLMSDSQKQVYYKFKYIADKHNCLSDYVDEYIDKANAVITSYNETKLQSEEEPNTLTISLDAILDKINNSGIDSLTAQEKEFLDNQNDIKN